MKKIIIVSLVCLTVILSTLLVVFVNATDYGDFDDYGEIWNDDDSGVPWGGVDDWAVLKYPNTSLPYMYDSYYWSAYDIADNTHIDMIYLAKSSDLLNWENVTFNPIYSENLRMCDFIYVGTNATPFWIFYSNWSGGDEVVDVLVSSDMENWSAHNSNPVYNNTDDVEDFRIIRLDNGTWIGVYEDDGESNNAVQMTWTTASEPSSGWMSSERDLWSNPEIMWIANPAICRDDDEYLYVAYEYVSPDPANGHLYFRHYNDFWDNSNWVEEDYICNGIPNNIILNNSGNILIYYNLGNNVNTVTRLLISNYTVDVSEDSDPQFMSINNQQNNTAVLTGRRYFNWTKIDTASAYQLQISNSSTFSTTFFDANNITEGCGFESMPGGNYTEKGGYVEFYLPYAYNISWYGNHYYRVRAYSRDE